jgi:dUTP pyrophosphatase
MESIKIKLFEGGVAPVYKYERASCLDCFAKLGSAPFRLKPLETKLIPLGFALQLPVDKEAEIRPRSGNSKNGILVHLGTIDSDYIGEVHCCVTNLSEKDICVKNGDRICQIKIQPRESEVEWELVNELEETERGTKGFGSTGK